MVRHRFMNGWVAAVALLACVPAMLLAARSGNGWSLAIWGAKLSAFLAFGWLCTVLVLSSRHHALEQRLGGLDAMYLMHHMAGMAALLFMAAHPVLLIVAYRSSLTSSSWILPWAGLDTALGTAALVLALVLVVLSLCHWLPYQEWLTTHRGMGAVLALSALHTFRIGTNVSGLIEYVLYLYLAAGAAAYVYKIILYPRVGPRFDGTIGKVVVDDSVTIFTIALTKNLRPAPGQFVYVSLRGPAVPREPHPFSIVKYEDAVLSIAAAPSGDYTRKLRAVSPGTHVSVYGPYGAMHRHHTRSERPELWIAGGIGITPFVSLWNHAVANEPSRKILLVWSLRGSHSTQIQRTLLGPDAAKTYLLWDSGANGRLTGDQLAQIAPFDVRHADIMLCGPDTMMYSISKQLIALGVPAKNIYYETFSYRD